MCVPGSPLRVTSHEKYVFIGKTQKFQKLLSLNPVKAPNKKAGMQIRFRHVTKSKMAKKGLRRMIRS